MVLIGLCGKMGTGKDYIANKFIGSYLTSTGSKWMKVSFADQLKINTMTRFNLNYEEIFEKKTAKTRKLLQKEGTDMGRNVYGQDIWIRYLENWLKLYTARGFSDFIITDVRFKNEIDFIRTKRGIVLKIESEYGNTQRLTEESKDNEQLYNMISNHTSETEIDKLDNHLFDEVIQNDNFKDDTKIKLQLQKVFQTVNKMKKIL